MAPHSSPSDVAGIASAAAAKPGLRRASLAARDGLDPAFRAAASAAIAAALLDLPALAEARTVAAYWPIRSEADPRGAAAEMHARGQRVALPQVCADDLVFRAWQPGEPLAPGRFGLSEPDAASPEVWPDALIVPLAAFDRAGRRIGYGRGYYDRAISRLSAGCSPTCRPVLTVGIAFAAQEVERVPVEAHDRPLAFVVTEAGPLRLDGAR